MAHTECFLLALLVATAQCLTLTQLKVPSQVDLKEEATMVCEFALDDERLYSIKWYKDDSEFYRYMPENRPPDQLFDVPGVNLKSYKSNMSLTILRLRNLTFKSSGTYRCEVSAEAPNFETVIAKGNMTVMALPDHEPLIEGIRTQYSLVDYVKGNCTSAPSNPPGSLTWFINGNKAEDWLVVHYATTVDTVDNVKLFTRSLGLRFQLFKQHFLGSGQKLKLSCIATIGERSWQRTVVSTLASNLTNEMLAQERHEHNLASSLASCISVLALMMTSHVLS